MVLPRPRLEEARRRGKSLCTRLIRYRVTVADSASALRSLGITSSCSHIFYQTTPSSTTLFHHILVTLDRNEMCKRIAQTSPGDEECKGWGGQFYPGTTHLNLHTRSNSAKLVNKSYRANNNLLSVWHQEVLSNILICHGLLPSAPTHRVRQRDSRQLRHQ